MSNNDGIRDSTVSTNLEAVDAFLAGHLMRAEKHLLGINLKYQVVSWLGIVKAMDTERVRYVAYVGGKSLPVVFGKIKELSFTDGFDWKKDRYQD